MRSRYLRIWKGIKSLVLFLSHYLVKVCVDILHPPAEAAVPICRPHKEGRLGSWCALYRALPRIEPSTSGLRVQRANHYTNVPLSVFEKTAVSVRFSINRTNTTSFLFVQHNVLKPTRQWKIIENENAAIKIEGWKHENDQLRFTAYRSTREQTKSRRQPSERTGQLTGYLNGIIPNYRPSVDRPKKYLCQAPLPTHVTLIWTNNSLHCACRLYACGTWGLW